MDPTNSSSIPDPQVGWWTPLHDTALSASDLGTEHTAAGLLVPEHTAPGLLVPDHTIAEQTVSERWQSTPTHPTPTHPTPTQPAADSVPTEAWQAPPTPATETTPAPTESWQAPPAPTHPALGGMEDAATGEIVVLLTHARESLTRAAVLAAATTGGECLSGHSDATVLGVLVGAEETARLIGSIQASVAAIIDDRSPYTAGNDGLSSRFGHRRASYLLEAVARISNSEATRRIRVGTAARSHLTLTGEALPAEYPTVGAAVHAGTISVDTAARIITGLDGARKHHHETDPESELLWHDSVRAAESHLVDAATDTAPDTVQVQIVQWRHALDPDGAEPRDDEIRSRRGFRQGRERNGITRNTWDTTGEDTALIKALLAESDAATQPRFFCEDDALHLTQNGIVLADPAETARLLNSGELNITDPHISTTDSSGPGSGTDSGAGSGDPRVGSADHTHRGRPRFRGTATTTADVDPETTAVVTKVTDLRTREQRHSDTLSGFLRAGLTTTDPGAVRSHVEVTAVVTAADLEAGVGVGWLDGVTEPVSLATIEQLACSNGIRTAVIGDDGELLYLGHKPRLFTKAIRRGVSVRDGGCCCWGDCNKPANQTDVHHVIPWSQGGKTDIDNAVMLCAEHHRQIHTSAFTIKMVNGKPFLLAPRYIDASQTLKALGKTRYTTTHTNHMNK